MLGSSYFENCQKSINHSVENVRSKLERWKDLKHQHDESSIRLSQLAVASSLKFEMQHCQADRIPPLSCELKLEMLSDNQILIIVHIENRSDANLIDWTLNVELKPVELMFQNNPTLTCSQTRNFVHRLPCVDAHSDLRFSIFYGDILYEEMFADVYLCKTFDYSYSTEVVVVGDDYDRKIDQKTVQICILKQLITILNYMKDMTSTDCFVPVLCLKCQSAEEGVEPTDIEDMSNKFTFRFFNAFVKLIAGRNEITDSLAVCRIIMKWIFPSLSDKYISTVNVEMSDKFLAIYKNIYLNAEHKLDVEIHKIDPDGFRFVITMRGVRSEQLIAGVKRALTLKYFHTINDSLNVPTVVPLDYDDTKLTLKNFRRDLTSYEDERQAFDCIFSELCSKLPFF